MNQQATGKEIEKKRRKERPRPSSFRRGSLDANNDAKTRDFIDRTCAFELGSVLVRAEETVGDAVAQFGDVVQLKDIG